MDQLGSTRMLTDNAGSTSVVRYDYQPFGQEILAGFGGRSTSMGYLGMADGTNPKYTGQERDLETADPNTQAGLDWFNTRYLSSPQGRFQSPDPGNAGADPTNPQTWNGFAYVGNNPLSFTDPSGESFWSVFAGIFSGLGTFLATGDPLLGAEVGKGVNDTIESAENGQFPLGGLLELAGGGIGIAGDLLVGDRVARSIPAVFSAAVTAGHSFSTRKRLPRLHPGLQTRLAPLYRRSAPFRPELRIS